MKRTLCIFLFLCFVSLLAIGQETIYDDKRTIYRKEVVGGIHAHTDGWGVNFSTGKYKTAFKKQVFQLELLGMKHPKEVKSFNPYSDSRGYIFGKQNALFLLRPSVGIHKVLFDKIRSSGVEVGFKVLGGPVLGFVKPIYLEIGYPDIGPTSIEFITVEKYDSDQHKVENIFGGASGLRGFDELSIEPGLHFNAGVVFEHSSENDVVKALEAGVSADIFTKEVPIMAVEENKQFFFTFYLNLLFGKKVVR